MANLEEIELATSSLKSRVAALEMTHVDYRALVDAIKAFGNTQTTLADVLRDHAYGMRSTVEDLGNRMSSLERKVAELAKLIESTRAN